MKAHYDETTRVKASIYKPKIRLIQEVIAKDYGMTLEETQHHGRKGSSITARRRIAYFSREFNPLCPLSVIGLLIGNGRPFDHATISHANTRMNEEMTLSDKTGKLCYPEVLESVNRQRKLIRRAIIAAKFPTDILMLMRVKRLRYHFKAMFHKSRKFKLLWQIT
jgi:hypothetical protein